MVKLPIKASKNASETLITLLKEMFKMMKDAAPLLVLYEYEDNLFSTALTAPDQINGQLSEAQKYFYKANPRKKAGDVWFNLSIGIDEPIH